MASLKLYALHCGGDMMDMALFDPFDPDTGTKVYNPYFMYVVTHPDGNLLFDSGAHPDLRTDPRSRLGDASADFELRLRPQDHIEQRLGAIGLMPRDIDVVVQSHLHFDHAGGLGWLTHAPILVQREELAFARKPPVYQELIYVQTDYGMDLDWRELEGDHDVFGDGRVNVIPTPGHTKGHQSLLVRLDRECVFLLADAAYLLAKMRSRSLPGILWSPDAVIASWDRIEEIERSERARLITTHALDYETSVKMAPDGWYE
ncbi:MAG: N-acyl homoserine lactonase family protein [Solirubrobacterales bacterium]|nr:N-acyl homoserine lactonase family protein [Solirubrobacterales bacterium]MBV9166446.1 N-acyl homoserine lactonase family protein [Solirubrobacterales bacterium]MBV9535237.1 N-acyl homoserine lactonase family protein [Solirubrobacterales bacterium]